MKTKSFISVKFPYYNSIKLLTLSSFFRDCPVNILLPIAPLIKLGLAKIIQNKNSVSLEIESLSDFRSYLQKKYKLRKKEFQNSVKSYSVNLPSIF